MRTIGLAAGPENTIEAVTHHVDEIGELHKRIDSLLSLADETGADPTPALAELDWIIAAAHDAKTTLSARPALTVAA